MSFKNHYETLGVSPQSSVYQIKKKFRQLAMQYHPDLNASDEFATRRFRELQEAYETLSHPAQREKYDFEWNLRFPLLRHNAVRELTPLTIWEDSVQLNKKIAGMDRYRMNKEAIFHRIGKVISEPSIAVLVNNNNNKLNQQIIQEIICASSVLPFRLTLQVAISLKPLANSNQANMELLSAFIKSARRQHYWELIYPLVVLLITFTLCMTIYLLSK